MSIDSRLREGLRRSMPAIEVDPDRRFDDARRIGRRRRIVRRAGASLAVAVIVALAAFAAPGVLGALRDRRTQPQATPSPLAVVGIYTTTIAPRDAGATDAVGTWLLQLGGDGTLDLSSLTNGAIAKSQTSYQISSTGFVTIAFDGDGCSGVGTYSWSRNGSSLVFAPVSDPCTLRVAIFSSQPWSRR